MLLSNLIYENLSNGFPDFTRKRAFSADFWTAHSAQTKGWTQIVRQGLAKGPQACNCMLSLATLCYTVLFYADDLLCNAVLCCAVLCCAVLCCAVLCCAVLDV